VAGASGRTRSSWTRGNAYVNGADISFVAGALPKPGYIKLVTPDGHLRQVADYIQLPTAWSSPRAARR
jgi:hypothetical protein